MEQLKVFIWMLTSFLFLLLSWQPNVEELMPPEFVFAFWTLSESFTLVGGYMLFIHGLPNTDGSSNIMKGVLWLFAVALSVLFASKKIKGFPLSLVILVYAKAGFVILGGFYKLFLSRVAPQPDPILRV